MRELSDAFLAGLLPDIGIQIVDRVEPVTFQGVDREGWHDEFVAVALAPPRRRQADRDDRGRNPLPSDPVAGDQR